MARMNKSEQQNARHEIAMANFNRDYDAQREIRLQCLEDRRFVHVPGAQWEDSLGKQFANRPRYEVNKLAAACTRIFSEYRNNRITVDFRPEDGDASAETADLLDGLYRADENRSNAQEAYDNAFDEGVSGGFGAWRLRNEYADEYDEDDDWQNILIEPIYDADSSVIFDADAKRQDKRDAKRAWVIVSMTHEQYEDKFGKSPQSFNKIEKLTEFDWFTPEVVYIAEYYEVHEKTEEIRVYQLPVTGDEQKLGPDEDDADLLAQGYFLARKRKVKRRRVHKDIMDEGGILEDCGYIAGIWIPIIPFYGRRAWVDNVERISGHVRTSKDMQRLTNMEISMLAEIAAFSPIEKPIFTPEQVAGLQQYWADDNIQRRPYLLVNPIQGADGSTTPTGPVGFTKPPAVPESLIQLVNLTGASIAEMTGSQAQGEQVVSNTSARMVELVQNRLDLQVFIYMDNFAKSMRRCAEIWLSMAKDLYNERRRVRTVGEDGTDDFSELMMPSIKNGKEVLLNDLSQGKYHVVADVGPSFTTRRDGTVRTLTSMLQFVQDPEERAAILGIVLNLVDGEGLGDLREWSRKRLVKMGISKPTEEDMKEAQAQQQNSPPDANTMYLMAAAQNESAKAQKAKADTLAVVADAKKTEAETAKLLADTNSVKLDQVLKIIEQLANSMNPNQNLQQEASVGPEPTS